MARVLLDNLTKVFPGGITAVSEFCLDVLDSRCVAVVGPSGSGKTTLLRLIAGLEQPTAGKVFIDGVLVNDLPPRRRDVAMVFQNYALYPHMSVYENMAFALKCRRWSAVEADRQVRLVAKRLGIAGILARKPAALSGGQRQRVALGRAVVRRPKLFLFDEPLSNLDPALRLAMRAELGKLLRELDAASIYVTHDQAEAMTLGDRVCVILQGRAQQTDQPLSVYQRPVNRFVAGFIGTPAMNFLEGRVHFAQGSACFVAGSDSLALPASFNSSLQAYAGRKMVLGIRPHDLRLLQGSQRAAGVVTGKVSVIEPLGNRADVHVITPAGLRLTASIEPHGLPRCGEQVSVGLDLDKAHLFEPGETGKNVTLSAPR